MKKLCNVGLGLEKPAVGGNGLKIQQKQDGEGEKRGQKQDKGNEARSRRWRRKKDETLARVWINEGERGGNMVGEKNEMGARRMLN